MRNAPSSERGLRAIKGAVLLVAAATTLAGIERRASAAPITWNGTTTSWSTNSNWSGGSAPGNGDIAVFQGSTANATPTISNGSINIAGIDFATGAQSYTISGASFTINGTLTITEDSANNEVIGSNLTGGNGSQTLALTGNGGVATLSGIISQFNGSKIVSVTKGGSSTFILSGTNSYVGTTTVSGGNLIINGSTTASAFTINGNATSGGTLGGTGTAGTMTLSSTSGTNDAILAPGAISNGIGTLSSGNASFGNNSLLAIDLNAGTADRLTVTGTLGLNSGSGIAINTIAAPTLGNYVLVSNSAARTGTFSTSSGVPTNYRVIYNANEIDLQHQATASITASASATRIITGGSASVTALVKNTAIANSSALSYSLAGSGGLNSLAGPFSRTAGDSAFPGGTSNSHGLTFTSTTIGTNTATVSVNDPNATNNGASASVNIDVLDHSLASFNSSVTQNALTLNFGSVARGINLSSQSFNIYNLVTTPAYTAALDLDSVSFSGSTAFGGASKYSTFSNLAAGSSQNLSASLDTTLPGSKSATYVFHLSDEKIAGSAGNRDLTLTLAGDVTGVSLNNNSGLASNGSVVTTGGNGKYIDTSIFTAAGPGLVQGDITITGTLPTPNSDAPIIVMLDLNGTSTDITNLLTTLATAPGANYTLLQPGDQAFDDLASHYPGTWDAAFSFATPPTGASAGSMDFAWDFTGSNVQLAKIVVVPEPGTGIAMAGASALASLVVRRRRYR